MLNVTERWLPVIGYEGLYEVSDLGRVRSITHTDRLNRLHPGKVLSQFKMTDGYLAVGFTNRPGNRVHHLVLEAFHDLRPDGTEARHLNGNHLDNRAANLKWGTKSENNRDQVHHGTHPKASRTHCPQGHPYDEANTYITVAGGRQCRACERARAERRRHPAPPRTHCKRGHEFTPENTYEQAGGYRGCLECKRQRDREGARRARLRKEPATRG